MWKDVGLKLNDKFYYICDFVIYEGTVQKIRNINDQPGYTDTQWAYIYNDIEYYDVYLSLKDACFELKTRSVNHCIKHLTKLLTQK